MSETIRMQRIKAEFKGVFGAIDMYIDATRYHFIDVDDNRLDGILTSTASCGCCSEYIDYESEISYELEYLDDSEYEDLISQLQILKVLM